MEITGGNFRHILLFYVRKGKTAAQAHRKWCSAYDDAYLSEGQCQIVLHDFVPGTFDLKRGPGLPTVEKVDEIDDEIPKGVQYLGFT